jgi:hypothetical protein
MKKETKKWKYRPIKTENEKQAGRHIKSKYDMALNGQWCQSSWNISRKC